MRKILFLLFKLIAVAKYLFFPMMLGGQTPSPNHCAKDDYPSTANIIFNGPANDKEGRILGHVAWIVPFEKVKIAGKGFLVSHPSYNDECVEEESPIMNEGIRPALISKRDIIISITTRNGTPDSSWKFVMAF